LERERRREATGVQAWTPKAQVTRSAHGTSELVPFFRPIPILCRGVVDIENTSTTLTGFDDEAFNPFSLPLASRHPLRADAVEMTNVTRDVGMSRADLHVHTTYSDGTATPVDVLNFYALNGSCSVLAITDHDTLAGARVAQRHALEHADVYGKLQLIPGEEVSSRQGHILGLFLDETIPPDLSAAETVDAIHAQGGVAIAAHPYTRWLRWIGLVGVGDLIRELPFDAVETRNSNFTEIFANRKAERNAQGKAQVGSSDGHFLDALGRCFTAFPGSTPEDLRASIQARSTVPGGQCYGPATLCKYVLGRLKAGGAILPRRRQHLEETARGGLDVELRTDSSVGIALLALRGRLDGLSMPELKVTLKELAEERWAIVLDFSAVSKLDSFGTTALVAGLLAARAAGVGFALASVPARCQRVLASGGLAGILPQAPTVEMALGSIRTRDSQRERVENDVLSP